MIRFPIVNLKNSLGLMFDKQEENQMTYVRIGGSSFSNEDIFAFVVVILVIGIASWIGYFILKSKDNSKPLEKAKVKILEKPVQKGNIEWYVVEFENGERKNLEVFMQTPYSLQWEMKVFWSIEELRFKRFIH